MNPAEVFFVSVLVAVACYGGSRGLRLWADHQAEVAVTRAGDEQEPLQELAPPSSAFLYEVLRTPSGHGVGERGYLDFRPEHKIVTGMTRSGKGNLIQLIVLAALAKVNVVITILDPKGGLDYGAFKDFPNVTLYRGRVGGKDNILEGLTALESAMNARQELLFQEGSRNVGEHNAEHPDNVLPYQLVICDEVADFTKEQKDKVDTLAAMGGATGFILVVATQHPLAKHLSTTLQTNAGQRFCFRVPTTARARIAAGVESNDELEFNPALIGGPGVAVKIDADGYALVRVPLLTTTWRAKLLDELKGNLRDNNSTPVRRPTHAAPDS